MHFAIRDTGVGIPLDKQRLIFEPFTQADGSATRQYGGTGLGLAIVKQLVEMMQGELWLESTVDQGSTFHFTIRFVNLHIEGKALPDREQVRDLPVLIVDDNTTNRRILYDVLSHGGMRPTLVESGQAALAALTHARDLGGAVSAGAPRCHDAKMDGFTLAAHLQHDPTLANAIIMMLTSRGQRHDALLNRYCGVPDETHHPGGTLASDRAHAEPCHTRRYAISCCRQPRPTGDTPLFTCPVGGR